MTLRALAEKTGVDFTYLSKIENDKVGYLPSADTIRTLASALNAEPLELLELADKIPPELKGIARHASARRFLQRAKALRSAEEWDEMLDFLEARRTKRNQNQEDR